MSAAAVQTATGQPAPTAAKKTLPSVGRQKSFIMEHAAVLNRETKLAILAIVMMEIVKADPDQSPGAADPAPGETPTIDAEQARLRKTVVTETGPAREIDLNLGPHLQHRVLAAGASEPAGARRRDAAGRPEAFVKPACAAPAAAFSGRTQ